ncbi:PIG-L deacetylase family protein [Nonomuraea cypriaca]|uniref:PIG-L deacetylase family protein n=1 Tax=Nonomuraea cypriaca TaxID=1187855 RepID=UPI001A9CA139|nr:PIG-L deacetylase family protein [Nonomuraea cypriaca]
MTLPALPEESFQRVLCVVAHPDDMEYGTSAAVARWTARGIEVGYLLLTPGEAGMPNPPQETARLRVAEQQAACAVVGVKHLTVLEHPDGVLVYGLDLRRDICREIRRFKPDVVLGTGYEIETPYGFDQADHRAARLATLDAVRDAGNRWVFPEQVDDEDLQPHSVRWFIVPGLAGSATHGVEVTGERCSAVSPRSRRTPRTWPRSRTTPPPRTSSRSSRGPRTLLTGSYVKDGSAGRQGRG